MSRGASPGSWVADCRCCTTRFHAKLAAPRLASDGLRAVDPRKPVCLGLHGTKTRPVRVTMAMKNLNGSVAARPHFPACGSFMATSSRHTAPYLGSLSCCSTVDAIVVKGAARCSDRPSLRP